MSSPGMGQLAASLLCSNALDSAARDLGIDASQLSPTRLAGR